MAKKNILVKIIIDSREKDLSFIEKQFKFDKKYASDKIMISGYEIHTPFKCLDKNGNEIKTSTSDCGIEYSLDDGITWHKTNLAIELKKDSDMSSTLYSNWKRFSAELDRAKEYGLDFYIIYNQSTKSMKEHFAKLKVMGRIPYAQNPEATYYDKLIEVSRQVPLIYTHEIHVAIRRLIKNYIKENKLQYK